MPLVLTRCPTTSAVVPTKLWMDSGTFRLIALQGHLLDCPQCGARHEWTKAQAWVEGDPELQPGEQRDEDYFPYLAHPRARADRDIPAGLEDLWQSEP